MVNPWSPDTSAGYLSTSLPWDMKKINETFWCTYMTNPPTILSTSLFSISFGCSLSCLEDCFAVISTDCMQIVFPSTISLTVTVRVYIVHAMVSKAIWLKNNSSGRTGHQETSTSTMHCHMRLWDTFLIWFGVMIIHLQFTHCILKRILSIQLSRFSIAKPGSDQSPLTGQRHPVNNTLSQEMPRTPTNRRTEEHRTTMRAKLCQIEICTNFLPSLDTFHPSLQLLQSLLGVSFLLPTLLFGSWCRLRCPSERHLWRRDRTWQSADFKAGEFAFVIGLITSKS